jgi:hypothetical protein
LPPLQCDFNCVGGIFEICADIAWNSTQTHGASQQAGQRNTDSLGWFPLFRFISQRVSKQANLQQQNRTQQTQTHTVKQLFLAEEDP